MLTSNRKNGGRARGACPAVDDCDGRLRSPESSEESSSTSDLHSFRSVDIGCRVVNDAITSNF